MAFELPPLPYSHGALAERGMCQETLELHHDKHHQAYVTALNGFVEKNPALQGKSLEEIIKMSHGNAEMAPVFNNAGQHWNHILFWENMSPHGGSIPGKLEAEDRVGPRRRAEVQGRLQGGRGGPVRLGLGVAGAGRRRQAEDHQDAERQQSAGRPARARRCWASTCGSTATTWTSAIAGRIT